MSKLEKELRILIAIASVNVNELLEKDNVTVQELDDAFSIEQHYTVQLMKLQGQAIDMDNFAML